MTTQLIFPWITRWATNEAVHLQSVVVRRWCQSKADVVSCGRESLPVLQFHPQVVTALRRQLMDCLKTCNTNTGRYSIYISHVIY